MVKNANEKFGLLNFNLNSFSTIFLAIHLNEHKSFFFSSEFLVNGVNKKKKSCLKGEICAVGILLKKNKVE